MFYLVLNVLVSACTTMTVLWLWDRARPYPVIFGAVEPPAASPAPTFDAGPSGLTPVPVSQPGSSAGSPEAGPAAGTQDPAALGTVLILDNVFGVGSLENEVVVLKRVGEGELALSNWTLADEDGNRYTFPALILYSEGAVQLHTGGGVPTVVDLYWGLDAPVWEAGEIVTVYDGANNVRATYQIP
jgi:hypothetical protein